MGYDAQIHFCAVDMSGLDSWMANLHPQIILHPRSNSMFSLVVYVLTQKAIR